MIGHEPPAGRADLPSRPMRRARPLLAVIAGLAGFPLAIWFNRAILPTDGPGPIGFGTALLIIVLLFSNARQQP